MTISRDQAVRIAHEIFEQEIRARQIEAVRRAGVMREGFHFQVGDLKRTLFWSDSRRSRARKRARNSAIQRGLTDKRSAPLSRP